MHSLKNEGTEQWWIWSEVLKWEWVEHGKDFLKVTHKKEKEVVDMLNYWSRFGEIIPGHSHPVINGVVNLHPSDEDGDLWAWKHQYEEYGIEHQRILWFDTTAPYDMWRVKYTWDGKLVHHDLNGKKVQVSKIDRKWNGVWRDRDIELEDTWNLSVLEDDQEDEKLIDYEKMYTEWKILDLKDRRDRLDQLPQVA